MRQITFKPAQQRPGSRATCKSKSMLTRLLLRARALGSDLPRSTGGIHIISRAVHSDRTAQKPMPPGWPPLSDEPESDQMLIPSPPPSLSEDNPAWGDDVLASPLDVRRRIFCNRSLNMASVRAVGFDMDYTLSQYRPETFEMLAYTLTVQKLVEAFGYPESIRDFKFDWRYMVRGLTIDKQRGNILKIDRHKYVKLATHGFEPLSRQQRLDTYNAAEIRHDYDEPDFATIDTLFSLAEAHLFMQLVELHDSQSGGLLSAKSYADMYREVRTAVDLCHRDGSLKREVAADPAKYIHEDLRLRPLLEMLRGSGRKLFLATNSLWDYTHVIMNFLLSGRSGASRNEDWLEFFDVVICGCGKPAYFVEKKPLFEVQTSTGLLHNTNGGSAITPIGEADLPTPGYDSSAPTGLNAAAKGVKSRVFQGGNHWDLHKMLEVKSGAEVNWPPASSRRAGEPPLPFPLHEILDDLLPGDFSAASLEQEGGGAPSPFPLHEILDDLLPGDFLTASLEPEVLYVSDHIYSDLNMSKKSVGWRTMLVVPELQTELVLQQAYADVQHELRALRQQREALEDQVERCHQSAPGGGEAAEAAATPLRRQEREVRDTHSRLLQKHHQRFHRVWGQLMKTGYQNSRFAHQVERFACLYTSHVSNLSFYSPNKSYRGRMDCMAHEETTVMGAGRLPAPQDYGPSIESS